MALKSNYLKPFNSMLPNKNNKWHPGISHNNLESIFGEKSEGLGGEAPKPAAVPQAKASAATVSAGSGVGLNFFMILAIHSALSAGLSYLEIVMVLNRV